MLFTSLSYGPMQVEHMPYLRASMARFSYNEVLYQLSTSTFIDAYSHKSVTSRVCGSLHRKVANFYRFCSIALGAVAVWLYLNAYIFFNILYIESG